MLKTQFSSTLTTSYKLEFLCACQIVMVDRKGIPRGVSGQHGLACACARIPLDIKLFALREPYKENEGN